MKNLILKAVLFVSLISVSISCNKDDAPAATAEASLVGKWEPTQETDELTGNLVPYEHETGCSKNSIEFTASEFIDKYYENTPTVSCDYNVVTSTYIRSGNTLTVTDSFETYTVTILALSATELKLDFGSGDIYVLKRI